MAGIGIIVMYIGYAVAMWGVNSFQGNTQAPFIQQIFPFAGSGMTMGTSTGTATAPAGTTGPTTSTGKVSGGKGPTGTQGPQTGNRKSSSPFGVSGPI